ncbi:MAG: cupredoxin domain-containing protein [Actinomycetota bacterium]|nr:cupredoxin domain-containing protein [Actinomycetota bacterium]
MRIRSGSAISAILSLVFVASMVTPARAATVTVVDFSFSPGHVKVAQGGSVSWDNGGTHTHTSTYNGALALWNTGNIAPGTTSNSVTLRAAGTYPYHCTIHTQMTGSVKVPIKVSVSGGTATITLASATQSAFSYDVQKMVGSGSWTSWKTGVTTRMVTFSGSAGTYSFRSRLHRDSNDTTSKWSPSKTITIS